MSVGGSVRVSFSAWDQDSQGRCVCVHLMVCDWNCTWSPESQTVYHAQSPTVAGSTGKQEEKAPQASVVFHQLLKPLWRLQPPVPAVFEICNELWLLDENRCTVSGRQPGEGKRPWVNRNAQILIDSQVPASRITDARMARRPLFAQVAPEVLAKPTLLCLVKLFDVFQHMDHQATFTQAEDDAIDEFIKIVARTAVMRRAFRYAVDVLGLDLEESEDSEDSWRHFYHASTLGPRLPVDY